MRIHAIQTGTVKIKTAQVEGRGQGFRRQLAVYTDRNWTEWLPTYAWAIEHPEGVIVVDTGQGVHLLETSSSYHPFHRWEVAFRIEKEEEIGPQLSVLGIGPRDVKKVVLTHLHMDHDGGLAHFPNSEILGSSDELRTASGWAGRIRGYLPDRWPSWFAIEQAHQAGIAISCCVVDAGVIALWPAVSERELCVRLHRPSRRATATIGAQRRATAMVSPSEYSLPTISAPWLGENFSAIFPPN